MKTETKTLLIATAVLISGITTNANAIDNLTPIQEKA